ncbi:MAG: ABC transporter substrate-binding protein [Clostridiales bacterium]|nr:ABC transporter substrate-binding protein [Clostridiales bacterium]
MKKTMNLLKTLLVTLMCLMLILPGVASAEQYKVGIIQMADNGAFEDMREGYIDQMRALGYSEDVMTFDYRNAQGDMATLMQICQKMVDDEVDFVVTIATPPTQAFMNMDSDIPMFFISVSNPVGAGVISDMEHPDMNATGTSNAIPVSEMFALADQLTPGIKTYGLLYCLSEINSVTTANQAKEYLDAHNLAYVEAVVTSTAEVMQAVDAIIDRVDAIFVPNDSVVQTAMPVVAEAAADAGIPVYGSSAVMVASGAFATISISDRDIGAITADMCHKFLQGTPIEEIPAIVVDQFTTVINTTTAAQIGVTISEDVAAAAQLLK